MGITSPRGFLASKCYVGNWIFSKSWEFFGDFFGNFLDDFFGRNFLGGIFWEDILRGILCLHCESYLNMKGIDLFVKILVFVKILSQWKKERRRIFNP